MVGSGVRVECVVGRLVCDSFVGAKVPVVVVGTGVRGDTMGIGVGLSGTAVSATIGAIEGIEVVSEIGGNVRAMDGAGEEVLKLPAAGQRSACGPTCSVLTETGIH